MIIANFNSFQLLSPLGVLLWHGSCIHHSGHCDLAPTVIGHLQVTHDRRLDDRPLSKSPADCLNGIIQLVTPVQTLLVDKQVHLCGLPVGNKVNGTDANGTDGSIPLILLLKQLSTKVRQIPGATGGGLEVCLLLLSPQFVASDCDLNAGGIQPVYSEPMPNILLQLQHDLPDFLVIIEVSRAGDAVADGFHRGHEVLMHNPGFIPPSGISPKVKPTDTEESAEEVRVGTGQLPDGMDAVLFQLLIGSRTYIKEV